MSSISGKPQEVESLLLLLLHSAVASGAKLKLVPCFSLLKFSIFSIQTPDLIIPSSVLSLTRHLLTIFSSCKGFAGHNEIIFWFYVQ